MEIADKAKRVHRSYMRAGGRALISAFYDHLMESEKEIREKFEQVDMDVQTENLARAIIMSFLFAGNNHQTAEKIMDKVRESHNRHNLNIEPHLYDIWLQRLIETVAVCDPEADDELLADWRTVLSHSVEHIRSGY